MVNFIYTMQSKANLELKHHCPDFKKIREVLKNIGAKKCGIRKQKDYFFNLAKVKGKVQPRLKLRVENKTMTLVYYERPDFSSVQETLANVMLYPIADRKFLAFLIASLGVEAIVEKRRELWKKGNTVFNVDTVKGIGNIFEVELQTSGKITPKEKAMFKEYQKRFTPYLGKVVRGSNVDLVKKSLNPS